MLWFPLNIPLIPKCIILVMTLHTTAHALLPSITHQRWFKSLNQINFILIIFWLLHYLWPM
jgi:hypothetical protein